ncbi:radical SAM protein [uncultured Gimesia sp.]|uniref:radical SAM protein n=1 Tax=uncultured Gimesia sp. TaxID=1678688 RepID=UPI0030D929AA|tara:strand:+ start:109781 stop:110566 length:786 start_codon:yes stop_codon:yes gene_type:complete
MYQIRNLEIHASYSCNLSCKSCSHFSDQQIGKNVPLEEIASQMMQWSGRIQPKMFSILGGEPALNKQLVQIVRECRKQWPFSKLRLISNGFYLKNHPELPLALQQAECDLEVSVHHGGEEYTEKLKPVRELLAQWSSRYNFVLKYRPSASKWRTTFEGSGSEMVPFNDGNPEESYKVCVAKNCPQIHEGKIWKCPQLAYLGMVDIKHQLSEEWQKYLSYRPLYPTCSDAELQQFFETKAEPACAMCPSCHRHFEIPSPLRI